MARLLKAVRPQTQAQPKKPSTAPEGLSKSDNTKKRPLKAVFFFPNFICNAAHQVRGEKGTYMRLRRVCTPYISADSFPARIYGSENNSLLPLCTECTSTPPRALRSECIFYLRECFEFPGS